MDTVLIENWVREENAEFKVKGWKIALLIDNCPVHTEIENLSHVGLIFLTPNTIWVSQPIDQGVISSLRAY